MGTGETRDTTLSIDTQLMFFQEFFNRCMKVMTVKNRDYVRDGVPLIGTLASAVHENITVPMVLRILHDKHLSAIRTYERLGRLGDESVFERLRDIANYQALQAYYIAMAPSLHRDWQIYWEQQRCACESVITMEGTQHLPDCEKYRTLAWLADHQPSSGGFLRPYVR